MKSKDYIISKLNSFIKNFSQTKVCYQFEEDLMTHYIKVVPNSIYHNDKRYIDWELKLHDKFMEIFPGENICFISDDILLDLNNIDYELIGSSFIDSMFNTNNTFKNIHEHINLDKELFNCSNINVVEYDANASQKDVNLDKNILKSHTLAA